MGMTEKNETSTVEEEGNMAEPNEEDVSESDDRTQKQCPECPKKFKWSPNREGRMAFHMKREHKESAPRPSSKFAKSKFCYREYRGGAAKKNLRIHQTCTRRTSTSSQPLKWTSRNLAWTWTSPAHFASWPSLPPTFSTTTSVSNTRTTS